ncbi:hypothetical protein [Serratia marcescens]|uniref:hypothetical protein n=1 Tax=Serratia marcescens TaxID=615 RepID=UPI003D786BDB
MNTAYISLLNISLQDYHFKVCNLNLASALAPEVRQRSLCDHQFRLYMGINSLLGHAEAAGDEASAAALRAIVKQCAEGEAPQPIELQEVAA